MDRGIFVDGKPLDDYLGVEKDKETKNEFTGTVAEITKCLFKPVVPSKPTGYVKHSRAKHLNPDQIRKEYGLMSKPLEPFWMNLLYLLEKEGPLASKDLMTLTKLTRKQSGLVSTAMHKLQEKVPEHIKRGSDTRWEISGATADQIAKIYNSRKGRRTLKDVFYPKSEENIIKIPNPAFTTPPEERDRALEEMKADIGPEIQPDLIKNVVQQAVETVIQQLGIKVKIEGTIKILFGFDK